MATDYESERVRMVDHQIRARGIRNASVLQAFLSVPRHEFVPKRLRPDAYRDSPLPIGEGQTISQPYMVAAMTEVADIQVGDRVLEIGTGSGYQAAILVTLGAEVFSIERIKSLAQSAQEVLSRLGYTVKIRVGDGTLGWPEEAPFHKILVTAGAPSLPPSYAEQLLDGGRIIIPLEDGLSQVLCVFHKKDGRLEEKRHDRCTFVPLIGEFGW